ncbi:DUF3515 family protein [Compostimonas suwonensis]|uniref:Uncharacterized protein DUF3515 n=1 Tax=Compostimonas suwonensis TaxID=1048394 RepID=A0A2M9C008_9MICO|nr:DUF3515 family protein [Compostimonas suwonensis]PJJ63669.1 uncharacterized protein DUF3515 [Compostimonas suwonensis]
MSSPAPSPVSARRLRRALVSLLAVAGLAGVLTACAPTVALTAAPAANEPACASVTVALPETVAGQPSRETNAQATGAWGDPAAVLLHCGVAVPGPTTTECLSVNGVDWLADDTDAPSYRYTTYGRDPAVEVVVDSTVVSGTTALIDLQSAVTSIPAERACVGAQDVYTPTDAPEDPNAADDAPPPADTPEPTPAQ